MTDQPCGLCGTPKALHHKTEGLHPYQVASWKSYESAGANSLLNYAVERHLGGPDDDHYAALPIQPIRLTEQMSEIWPRAVVYHLGEALAAILRVGSKGQDVRDLRKAAWLLERAADRLDGES